MEMALYISLSSLQFVWSLHFFFHTPDFKPNNAIACIMDVSTQVHYTNANTFYFLVQYLGGKT